MIEVSGGEAGGYLSIGCDHVVRRIAASPWNQVSSLLETAPESWEQAGLIPWSQISSAGDSVLLQHPRIRVISYPHEWCGEMLLAAAQMHCRLLAAIAPHGLALKDAHPWNVLFDGVRPVFVDIGSIVPEETLSSLDYLPRGSGLPPAAEVFRQMFIPFFVVPLAFHQAGLGDAARIILWRYALNATPRFPRLRDYLSSVPPMRWGRFLTAAATARRASRRFRAISHDLAQDGSLSRFAASLSALVEALAPPPMTSRYSGYYAAKAEDHDLASPETWNAKQTCIRGVLNDPTIGSVLDIACNTGWYARLAARLGKQVTAVDIDGACISALYRLASTAGEAIVPLVADLTRPTMDRQRTNSGGLLLIGSERRLRSDAVLALGILHHVVLGAGIPLTAALERFAAPARRMLIVEFVGINDGLVMKEPEFFKAFTKDPERFSGFTLAATRDLLSSMGWDVTILPSFPATRSLLICRRQSSPRERE